MVDFVPGVRGMSPWLQVVDFKSKEFCRLPIVFPTIP
jgi:hypothetical protein